MRFSSVHQLTDNLLELLSVKKNPEVSLYKTKAKLRRRSQPLQQLWEGLNRKGGGVPQEYQKSHKRGRSEENRQINSLIERGPRSSTRKLKCCSVNKRGRFASSAAGCQLLWRLRPNLWKLRPLQFKSRRFIIKREIPLGNPCLVLPDTGGR